MKNVIELNTVHARIEETRQALALAEGKEKEVLEVLIWTHSMKLRIFYLTHSENPYNSRVEIFRMNTRYCHDSGILSLPMGRRT